VRGEISVSCRDVSVALGRVHSVLAAVQNANSVRMFLARLIYLDAVGCVDFTAMGEAGIQVGGLSWRRGVECILSCCRYIVYNVTLLF
jgi:hypothetical protein